MAADGADRADRADRREPVVEGGEAACWLPWVCPECGRLAEDRAAEVCPSCGADLPEPG